MVFKAAFCPCWHLLHLYSRGNNDYTLYAGFKQVVGLQQQSDVRLSGVLVGKVTQITPEEVLNAYNELILKGNNNE